MIIKLIAAALAVAATSAKQPHVVFFLADDYGFADIGYHAEMYGHDSNVVNTPNLDRLAAEGVKLENYYIAPVCSPTRASLLTGRYLMHHGIHVPLVDSSPSGLPLDEVTWATKMQQAGYATAAVGKWHLGFKSWAHTPTERGFDYYMGYYAGSSDYWIHESLCWPGSFENGCFENTTGNGEPVTGIDLHRNRDPIFNNTEYSTKLFTTEAIDVINNHSQTQSDKPLFLYLPYQAVHVGNIPEPDHPIYAKDQAPEKYIEMYSDVDDIQRRNLSAMIAVMDEAALNVTEALKAAGMWEDTIFIFSTDNGGPVNDKASNYPLRGGKGQLWEGGVRGTGFVTFGNPANYGVTTAGSINNGMMHITDWFPTICEIAGCDMSGTKPLDGVSAWQTITANATSKRDVIVHDVCFGWMGGDCPSDNKAAVQKNNYKLIMNQDAGQTMLFDLEKDPSEKNDISKDNEDIMRELMSIVSQYNNSAIMSQDRFPPVSGADPRKHGGVWMPWE